jgi:hypothetical protein
MVIALGGVRVTDVASEEEAPDSGGCGSANDLTS